MTPGGRGQVAAGRRGASRRGLRRRSSSLHAWARQGQPLLVRPHAFRHSFASAVRARIGDLLGQLRDTHREHDSDTTERLATDNTALKQRVRDLTAQQRTLAERLQAARSNNRFLDKRIAGLEAQLLAAQPGS